MCCVLFLVRLYVCVCECLFQTWNNIVGVPSSRATFGFPQYCASACVRLGCTRNASCVDTKSKNKKYNLSFLKPLPTYRYIHFKTTFMCPRSIAGVPSSQALPGYLITAHPSVWVPCIIGALTVWIQNPKKKTLYLVQWLGWVFKNKERKKERKYLSKPRWLLKILTWSNWRFVTKTFERKSHFLRESQSSTKVLFLKSSAISFGRKLHPCMGHGSRTHKWGAVCDWNMTVISLGTVLHRGSSCQQNKAKEFESRSTSIQRKNQHLVKEINQTQEQSILANQWGKQKRSRHVTKAECSGEDLSNEDLVFNLPHLCVE